MSLPCAYMFVHTYCAANTYFCLVRGCISVFVRAPLSPVCMYVNLRILVYLYVNLRVFGPRTHIRLFVRVPLSPDHKGLTFSPNNLQRKLPQLDADHREKCEQALPIIRVNPEGTHAQSTSGIALLRSDRVDHYVIIT